MACPSPLSLTPLIASLSAVTCGSSSAAELGQPAILASVGYDAGACSNQSRPRPTAQPINSFTFPALSTILAQNDFPRAEVYVPSGWFMLSLTLCTTPI